MRAARWRACRACAWAACRTRRPCRCAIPGRAIPAAAPGCCAANWNSAAACARCSPAAGATASGSAVLDAAAHGFTWLRDLRALGTDAARLRARALVADWINAPPAEPVAHRPDVAGARIAAWLGHYDFFAATADDAFRQRLMARLVSDARGLSAHAARRGTGRARADRAEGPDRRRGGAAGARRLPDPRAALPAAGDRPPGAARRLPRRAQPGGAACGVAGPDRDPRPAASRADAAAAGAHQRDRAHGAGAARDAPRRRRPGAVQRQQGGEQQR